MERAVRYQKRKHWKYRVYEPVTVYHHLELPIVNNKFFTIAGSTVSIRENYAWDGPSGPAIDTKNSMTASLIHDALYQSMDAGDMDWSYRRKADLVYHYIVRREGMNFFRAGYQYLAIRLGYPIWKKFKKDYSKVHEV
jgi:hypothetical protein